MNIIEAAKESLEHPPDFAYYGSYHEEEGWGRAFAQHRDSDVLSRSNWQVISEDLLTRFPNDVHVELCNHWAVGWIEVLRIRVTTQPSRIREYNITECFRAVVAWQEKLEDYPVANEEHWSNLEHEEFTEYLEQEIPYIWRGISDDELPDHLLHSVYEIVSEQCCNADDLPHDTLENAVRDAWIAGLIADATAGNLDQLTMEEI